MECIEGVQVNPLTGNSILYFIQYWENGPGWNSTVTYKKYCLDKPNEVTTMINTVK